jgi:hypothetical protein
VSAPPSIEELAVMARRIGNQGRTWMIIGEVAELVLGVEAAGRSLEDVATPLSAQNDDSTGR